MEETGLTTQNQNTGIETADAKAQRAAFLQEMEKFTKTLNAKPNPEKVIWFGKANEKNSFQYLPVSVIEKDLDKMYFGMVQYEIVSYQQVFNEVACHARIKVFHPVLQQWLHYDGIGSAVLQQDANTKVQDFHLFKKSNAGQLAFPKSYAEAIKNAAKKIGKRFGADLNRKYEDDYMGFYKNVDDENNKPLNK